MDQDQVSEIKINRTSHNSTKCSLGLTITDKICWTLCNNLLDLNTIKTKKKPGKFGRNVQTLNTFQGGDIAKIDLIYNTSTIHRSPRLS